MIGRLLLRYREWTAVRWLEAAARTDQLRTSNRRHLAAQRARDEDAALRRLNSADRLLDAWERTTQGRRGH